MFYIKVEDILYSSESSNEDITCKRKTRSRRLEVRSSKESGISIYNNYLKSQDSSDGDESLEELEATPLIEQFSFLNRSRGEYIRVETGSQSGDPVIH